MSRLALLSKLRQKLSPGVRFSRPLVLIQSDDWGRVGVRDAEGLEELRSAKPNLGERPYDLYSLETAEDVHQLAELLGATRDSVGQPACMEMNFVTANVDFLASSAGGYREIILKPLAEGLPGRWTRPGLFDAYRAGIEAGLFSPALHGTTHFCQAAVARAVASEGPRGDLIRTLWKSETPYIHWRMPWVGYEYWDPEQPPAQRFLASSEQERWIGWAVQAFRKLFGVAPVSACAPGYRANAVTRLVWKAQGIRVVQIGPGTVSPPSWDEFGLLRLHRSFDFEPAVNPELRGEDGVTQASKWLARGLPFIVSSHSINFQSTLAPYRQRTLPMLRDFLSSLKRIFPDLLYVNSRQLLEIVETGGYESRGGRVAVSVTGMRKGVKA